MRTVRDVMHGDVEVLRTSETVAEAACVLAAQREDWLPLCQADGSLAGAVSHRDIVAKVVAKGLDPSQVLLAELADPGDVLAIDVDVPVQEAVSLMCRHDRVTAAGRRGRSCRRPRHPARRRAQPVVLPALVRGGPRTEPGNRARLPGVTRPDPAPHRHRPRPVSGTAVSLAAHVAAAAPGDVGPRPRRRDLARRAADPRRGRGGGPPARRRRAGPLRHEQLGAHPGPAAPAAWPTAASRRRTTTCCAPRTSPPGCSPRAPPRSSWARTASSRRWPHRGVTVVPEGPADAVVVGMHAHLHLRRARPSGGRGARRAPAWSGPTRTPPSPRPTAWCPAPARCWPRWPRRPRPCPRWPASRTRRRPTPSRRGSRAGELRAVVGDRPSTDGALAAQLGVPFALVLSGVTPPGAVPADTGAAATAKDLAALWSTRLLAGARDPKCLLSASTSYTLVQWRAMSAYASTSMRAPCSGRSAVAGPRRSCESW